jgi:hypothetical protein
MSLKKLNAEQSKSEFEKLSEDEQQMILHNKDKIIQITQPDKFAKAEYEVYDSKMPLLEVMRGGAFNAYYWSQELRDFLDEHKINYTVFDNKEEFLDNI